MKYNLIILFLVIVSCPSWAQKNCSILGTWYPQKSSFSVVYFDTRNDAVKVDTIVGETYYNVFNSVQLPDSIIFRENNIVQIFRTIGQEIRVNEIEYKMKRKRVKFQEIKSDSILFPIKFTWIFQKMNQTICESMNENGFSPWGKALMTLTWNCQFTRNKM